MDNLFKAKTQLLKIYKEFGYVIAEDIADVAVDYNLEDNEIDKIFSFLTSQGIKMYDSLKSAKECGEDVELEDDDESEDEEPNEKEDNARLSETTDKFIIPYYLRSLCGSESTYEKGLDIANNFYGRIKRFSLNGNILTAQVIGSNLYNISIVFDKNSISSHHCDCQAHKNYSGLCKHIVAVLIEMNHRCPHYSENNEPCKGITYITGDYKYDNNDLTLIAQNYVNDLKEWFDEEGESPIMEAWEFYSGVESRAFLETEDPFICKSKDNMKFLTEKAKSLAKENQIEITESIDESCTSEDDYYENEQSNDEFLDENDYDVDCGYRDDVDYDE